MKLWITLEGLCLAILLSNCSKSPGSNPPPEPDPEPIGIKKTFKISVSPELSTAESDDWVLFNDSTGLLLDAIPFEAGDNIGYETAYPHRIQKINISVVKIDTRRTPFIHNIYTYTGIDANGSWHIDPDPSNSINEGDPSGFFNVTVTDYPVDGRYYFSSIFGPRKNDLTWDPNFRTLSGKARLSENIPDWLFIFSKEYMSPRYHFFENVQPDANYTLSLADLKPFDKIVEVHFPETKDFFFSVNAVTQEMRYINHGYTTAINSISTNNATGGDPLSTLQLGYLDRFEKYFSYMQLKYGNRAYQFLAYGAAPDSFHFPFEKSPNLVNADYKNFSISNSGNPGYWMISFRDISGSNTYTNMALYGGTDVLFKTIQFPDSWSTKYPDFQPSRLNFTAARLVYGGLTYSDFLRRVFANIPLEDFSESAIQLFP